VVGRHAPGVGSSNVVITCHVRYEIDPSRVEAFERFARRWMELVERHGGTHHGYFLPSEGASDIAYALFSFPSLAEYERYRGRFGVDPEFIEADRIRDESGCVRRYERNFMRPLLP
jgi:hypothetical protein